MAVRSYRDLLVWQKAVELAVETYKVTRGFPKQEIYGLTAQLRRASASIASNIAEGQGRFSPREFVNFLSIAHGSLNEVETQLIIADKFEYISGDRVIGIMNLASKVGRMINGLVNTIRTPEKPANATTGN